MVILPDCFVIMQVSCKLLFLVLFFFSILINDLPNLTSSKPGTYADDATIEPRFDSKADLFDMIKLAADFKNELPIC